MGGWRQTRLPGHFVSAAWQANLWHCAIDVPTEQEHILHVPAFGAMSNGPGRSNHRRTDASRAASGTHLCRE